MVGYENGKGRQTGVEYLTGRHAVFRKQMLTYIRVIVAGIVFIELIICFWDIVSPSNLHLWENMLRVWFLIGVCILCERVFTWVHGHSRYSPAFKNRICCLTLFNVEAALAVTHYDSAVLWIAPAFVMIFSAVFKDKLVITWLYAASLAVLALLTWMLTCDTMWFSGSEKMLLMGAAVMDSGIYALSRMLYHFLLKQYEDLVKCYDGEIQLKAQLDTEYLTGLLSRAAISEKVRLAVQEAYFYKKQMIGVAMIDIDHFKQVNDNYGHDKGDVVLKRLSGIIRGHLNDNICAGRVGGEEFLILFRDYAKPQCMEILSNILKAFSEECFAFLPEEHFLTFSAGLSWMKDLDMQPATLIKHADVALYHSKENGRNRITEFRQNMLEESALRD